MSKHHLSSCVGVSFRRLWLKTKKNGNAKI